MSDSIEWALAKVTYDTYAKQADGTPIPQSSFPQIIAAMLRLLDVQPGMRVLEVGTGSAYSTALLAHLVGESGQVVSLDIDPALVERASRLLGEQGLQQVQVVAADGRAGYPAAAPFERAIAWASGDAVPTAWSEQVCPGGIVVAPIRLLALANTIAIARIGINSKQLPIGEAVMAGGFVPLSSQPRVQWRGYAETAALAVLAQGDPLAWIDTQWLRTANVAQVEAPKLLPLLLMATHQASPLLAQEDPERLRAYLLATHPPGFTTASVPAFTGSAAFGCSQADSLALLAQSGEGYLIAGKPTAAQQFCRWVADWRNAGRPGFEQMRPHLYPTAWGWQVRLQVVTNTDNPQRSANRQC